jgi:murein DD-endopeptidase MepM/ murein hydrolase activator NlpD
MSLYSDLEGRLSSWSDLDDDWNRDRRPAPGKMATTQRLAGGRWRNVDGSKAAVQAQGAMRGTGTDATGPKDDPFAVHLIAQQGVGGGGGALPHLAAIQKSFGHHDVGGVRAHVGGAAAAASQAIGARAYATGDAVAFAEAPDLHLAAHEAAHVVQQRGGVRLAGGVGSEGDAYEQHADAVADAVVRGESAQGLLDPMAHRGASGGPAVQGAALQLRRRTRYSTDPVPGPDGTATEEIDHAGLAAASLEQLCTAYAMEAPEDEAAPVTIGSARVTYAWIHGRVGTVVLRGEIRARLWAGRVRASEESAAGREALASEDGAAAGGEREEVCARHDAMIGGLAGDAARLDELRALVAELRNNDPALLDQHRGVSTFATRTGHGASAEDRAAVAGRPHHASDITAAAGTGVYAPIDGEVIFSGGHPGYGNLVRLLHRSPPPTRAAPRGPVESVYAHLSERLVAVGEHVSSGQAIGMIGRSTGDEEGSSGWVPPTTSARAAHLHLAVIPRGGDAYAEDTDTDGPVSHSTERENRSEVRPDAWLRELGVSISAAPLFTMSVSEAAAAQAAALDGGGARETGRESIEVPDAPGAAAADPVARFADEGAGSKAAPAGVDAPDAPAERHAEAVAAAVVRGESAAALLDAGPGAAAEPASVHRFEEDEEAAPRVFGTDTAVTLPEGVTQRDVDAAIAFNNGRQLRIDWVRRLQTHVRADGAMTSMAGEFDTDTVAGLMRLQAAEHLPVDGRVTPAMRRLLEERFPDLRATLLGSHTEATDSHRLLVRGGASLAERYAYYRGIITEAGGVFLDQPREINLLGIRGVELAGGDHALEVRQSGSAAEYATARAEDDAALADGSAAGDTLHSAHDTPRHFSGRRGADAPDGEGFDDLIVSLWFETPDAVAGAEGEAAGAPIYHVTEHRGSVDPASAWSASGANSRPTTEGTSHLRDGQYLYRLGLHGTTAEAHRDTVTGAFGEGHDERVAVADDEAAEETHYSALLPSRDLEVWRDRPGTGDDDHYLTAEEEEESDRRVVDHAARYTTRGIAIDIHSSPEAGPSSVGCQTIPPTAGYGDLIDEVRDSANSDGVYYTLIDASRIEAGLVIEQGRAMQPRRQNPSEAGGGDLAE